jgi:[NiFe] hydrogenase assembly HybE family chaperone
MQWRDGEQIRLALETTFNDILATRMLDLPVVNQSLSVRALGFERVNADWHGVLITPWFMNLLLLPGPDSTWITHPTGSKFERTFPYGSFEFTIANEAQLGTYGQCSLFSPMFEFHDQDAALAAAEAVLKHLLESNPPPEAVLPRTAISRRDLLRGTFLDREHGN